MKLEWPTQWNSQTSEEIPSLAVTIYHPDYSVRFGLLLLSSEGLTFLLGRLSNLVFNMVPTFSFSSFLFINLEIPVLIHIYILKILSILTFSLLVPKSFFFCKIQKAQNNSFSVPIPRGSRTSVVSRQTVSCLPSTHWLPAAFYLLVPQVFLGNVLNIPTHIPHLDF